MRKPKLCKKIKNCCNILFLLLLALPSNGQIIQQGTARELNSDKKPIPGVSIHFSDAQSEVSDENGSFRLVFQDKKPGDLIFLEEIRKRGYELVNEKDFEIVKISNTAQLGVDIILAVAGTVDAAKKEYYDVSDEALLAGFNREKRGLQKALQEAEVSQKEYLAQLATIQEAYDRQKEQLDALAEKFARVNFDDVEPYYEEALTLFKAGKIDLAIEVLESADPAKRTQQILQEEKRIALAQTELDSQKVALEREKRKQIAAVRLLADMYSLKFDPLKAEKQFDQLVALDSTDLDILSDAADFYRDQHRYDKAFKLYPLIISNSNAEAWQKANAYANLGVLYTRTGNLSAALEVYNVAFYIYGTLFIDMPTSYLFRNGLAKSIIKLGDTHSKLGQLDSALFLFQKSRFLYEDRINKEFPQNFELVQGLAIVYERLGITYEALGQLDSASTFVRNAISIFEDLTQYDTQNVEIKNGLAVEYAQLGDIHVKQNQIDSALIYYSKYRKIEEKLNKSFPSNINFRNNLAISYWKLGNLYYQKTDIDKARNYFKKAVESWQELASEFPQTTEFQRNLRIVQNKLRETQNITSKDLKVQQRINKLQTIEQQIEKERDPSKKVALQQTIIDTLKLVFEAYPDNLLIINQLANAYGSLAWYQLHNRQEQEAEKAAQQGLKIDPSQEWIHTNLAVGLLLQSKWEEAKVIYLNFRGKAYNNQYSWDAIFLSDLAELEKAGIHHPDIEKVRKLLDE